MMIINYELSDGDWCDIDDALCDIDDTVEYYEDCTECPLFYECVMGITVESEEKEDDRN